MCFRSVMEWCYETYSVVCRTNIHDINRRRSLFRVSDATGVENWRRKLTSNFMAPIAGAGYWLMPMFGIYTHTHTAHLYINASRCCILPIHVTSNSTATEPSFPVKRFLGLLCALVPCRINVSQFSATIKCPRYLCLRR